MVRIGCVVCVCCVCVRVRVLCVHACVRDTECDSAAVQ